MNPKIFSRFAVFIVGIFAHLSALSAPGGIVFSAARYSSNLETGITKAQGDVKITIGNQQIECDEVEIESAKQLVRGNGNIKFTSPGVVILAQQVSLDGKSGLGDFKDAILRKNQELYVEARELSRIGEFRYQGKDVKVSTCLDCPQAWSVTGSFADVEGEGYAEIHHALLQVKDSPILYFPVFVVPVKTKRQSGFLAPQLFRRDPDLGYRFKIPYYWASSQDTDSTWSYEFATIGGHRVNSEFRYQNSDRSYVMGNASYGRNAFLASVPSDRYGFSLTERYQFSPHFTQRYRGELASDTRYTSHYSGEFNESLRPFLSNEPSISYQSHRDYGFALMRFHKDNVIRDGSPQSGLDRLPELGFYRPFEKIAGPVFAEVNLHSLSLRRKGPVQDRENGWVREGDRIGMESRFFLSSREFSAMSYSPEIFVRGDYYRFPQEPSNSLPDAYRLRFQLSQQLSSEIFQVFNLSGNSELKALKHSIVPRVGWSYSPPEVKTQDHPFFKAPLAPRFDLFDPDSPDAQQVTIGTVTEEQKLRKHHILTLGLDTRVIGRYGATQKKYDEFFNAKIDQDINLASFSDANGEALPRLSPLKVATFTQYGGLKWTVDMAIDFQDRGTSDFRTDFAYSWSRYSVSLRERLQANAKTAGASVAIRDYGPWTLALAGDYNLETKQITSQNYQIIYTSPSKCWYFALAISKRYNQVDPDKFDINPMLAPMFGAAVQGKFL